MKKLYSFILINIGLILVTIGIVLFKAPNKFASGGVTGLSILINKLFPSLSIGTLMLVINIILLTAGLLFVGLEFEIKTIYSTIVLSILVWAVQKIFPITTPLTGDKILELIFSIIFLAAGSAILFYQNASSGGTDIIAKILNLKTHWHIGKTVLIVDFSISIFAFFIFGIAIGLYSILGVIIKGFLIDMVIRGLHTSKMVTIISSKDDEIRNYILNDLRKGVTVYNAIGGKTNTHKNVLHVVMGNKEFINLKKYIKSVDPQAFVIVDNVYEIIGKGFRSYEL
ncbi:MAG: YitT family protein [Clostridia bacterium]|nr:YitT family protein [Clostridia bacterium]